MIVIVTIKEIRDDNVSFTEQLPFGFSKRCASDTAVFLATQNADRSR